MRVLVTGADGFVGPHLARCLAQSGHDVIGWGGPTAAERALDIRFFGAVAAGFRSSRPDALVHLAGWSSVGASFERPLECFAVNALGTTHVLEAVRTEAPRARLLLISSGEVYGRSQTERLRNEGDVLAAASPYAVSKQAAELVALQYYAAFGTQVVIARAFNHVDPGQDPKFVVPSLLQQIIDVAEGRQTTLDVGNLEPVRDFCSVSDVVEAYALLLKSGVPGDIYNVCSGKGRSIRQVVDELLDSAQVHAEVRVDPARVRPVDIPHLVGDPAKLAALGWRAHREPFASLFPAR
jgi:GDP-4-dehydro-6-deoxy-D-mannose reductase